MALFCSPVLAQEGESCFFGLSTFTRCSSGLINTAGEWWSDCMCLRNSREQITRHIQSLRLRTSFMIAVMHRHKHVVKVHWHKRVVKVSVVLLTYDVTVLASKKQKQPGWNVWWMEQAAYSDCIYTQSNLVYVFAYVECISSCNSATRWPITQWQFYTMAAPAVLPLFLFLHLWNTTLLASFLADI